jgi:hypothetical protein
MTHRKLAAIRSRVWLTLCFGFASACTQAIADVPALILPDQVAAVQALNRQIDRAIEKVTAEDWAAASPLLQEVIDAPAFQQLPADRRHGLLTTAGGVAVELQDFKLAQTDSVQACAFPDSLLVDWQLRLYASSGLSDFRDAAIALTRIGKQWPAALTDVKDDLIFRILEESKKPTASATDSFELMTALFEARWRIDGAFEPSSVWRDFALDLLARGRAGDAKQASLRVTDPTILISMRADRRFDSIVKSAAEHFNIDKAVVANIANLRDIIAKSPRNLRFVVYLTYALLKARRDEEVLALTAQVTTTVSEHRRDQSPYDDANDNLIWVLNNRAIALGSLGRRDEELELLIRAARQPEHGESNVSQTINLGEFYCDLARPKDALFAIVDVQDESPYGRTQLEAVRLCASLQMSDSAAEAAALAYLKEHQADSPRTYQSALIDTGDFDAAAALLIERLEDPRMRSDALLEIQGYRDPLDLPRVARFHERFNALLQREDLRRAIAKVGRIETFDLRSDMP